MKLDHPIDRLKIPHLELLLLFLLQVLAISFKP